MEIVSLNDGLLTNLEVLEIIKERRLARSILGESKLGVETQHREYVEQKVKHKHIDLREEEALFTSRCHVYAV
eukprot:scaffold4505_cov165-Ochromonas_danica.AAC.7